MRTILITLVAAAALAAQPTVYLRDYGSGFIVTGASNATPIVIQTYADHGLNAGDTVSIWNVPFDSGTGCSSGGMLQGDFQVRQVVDSTHFAIADLSGRSVPSKGSWCDGSGGVLGGAQWGGRTKPYTLVPGMRGYFDGDNGSFTRQIALGTQNGLVSLTVSGTTATVVTAFDNYLADGAKIGVWGSGNTALDNSHTGYTVNLDSPTQFHFTVSGVPSGTYTNQNKKCGLSGDADCLRLSARAYKGNYWWDRAYTNFLTYGLARSRFDGGAIGIYPDGSGNSWAGEMNSGALVLLVDQANPDALAMCKYFVNHYERLGGVTWIVDETKNGGGYKNTIDFASFMLRDISEIYAVVRPWLSAGERQTFLDKVLNDVTDATPCHKIVPLSKSGATISFNGSTAVTGIGTLWLTDPDPTQRLAPGDVLYQPFFNSFNPQLYVTAVNSDTSLTVIPTSNTATFTDQAYTFAHAWQSGDCGLLWLQNHFEGAHTQPVFWAPGGGTFSQSGPRRLPSRGANNGYSMSSGRIAFGLAAADDDPRAVQLLEQEESWTWDYMFPLSLGYTTGFQRAGAYYSYGRILKDGPDAATWLVNGVNGFPDLFADKTWVTRPAMMKIYSVYPDYFGGYPWPAVWGTESTDNRVNFGVNCVWGADHSFRHAPGSPEASYLRNWLLTPHGNQAWSIYLGCSNDAFLTGGDPSIPSQDYTTLPTQYLFRDTSQATCSKLGMTCPATMRGDGFISRTGWTNTTDTHVLFQARTFNNDHDLQQGGSLRIYKTGYLVCAGSTSCRPGAGDHSAEVDNILEFGGTNNTLHTGEQGSDGIPAVAYFDRWAGSDPYGDGQSRYVYARADVAGMYGVPINRAKIHVVHFKRPGAEEIVVQYVDVDVAGAPTSVRGQIHYPQNGEAGNLTSPPEGTTTCPGAGGCPGLNVDRIIHTQEDGKAGRTGALTTRIFSPGTVTVNWDGASYTDNQGADNRVSICGGSSCGSSVSTADWLVVHKMMTIDGDGSLTADALNPEPRWTGVQTSSTVALFSRAGTAPISAEFQTTHSGTAQYLIAGLEEGHTYRAYRREDGADAAVQDVAAGDNTLYFEATAGTYLVFPAGLSNLFVNPLPPIRRRQPFQYDFKAAGDSASYIWSVSAGSLPPGITVGVDGVISGTATEDGQYVATIRAHEVGGAGYAEHSLTFVVTEPPLAVTAKGAAGRAYLAYGSPTLDAVQPCAVVISDRADFGTTVEKLADRGGAAVRRAVAGMSAPLVPGTTYYADATCGASQGSTSFTTPPAGSSVPIQLSLTIAVPSTIAATAVRVQYGDTPQLGGAVTAACAQSCQVSLSAMSNSIVYLRRQFVDSAEHVLAQSSIMPVVVGAAP